VTTRDQGQGIGFAAEPARRESAFQRGRRADRPAARLARAGLLGAACVVGLVLCALVLVVGGGSSASALGPSGVASPPMPALASGAFAPLPGAPARTLPGSGRSALQHAYGRMPLAFERNDGQFDRRAAFVARGAGYALSLTKRSAVLSLAAGASRGHRPARRAALTIGLVGASPGAQLSGEHGLPGKVNYLVGRNRSRWHTGVPTFGRVAYRDVWPGIGAAFYGHGGQLEYDFNVAAGADPGRIGLSFGGAKSVVQAPGGALVVRLAGGLVRQLRPHAYQTVAGVRRVVPSRYVVERGRVGVRLGSYDHRLPLVIDPALAYSTYLGGSNGANGGVGGDHGNGIAVDSNGSAYVTGYTLASDFPTKNPLQGAKAGGYDVFVTKLSADGSTLIYSTYLGGEGSDFGAGIAVDASGSAYIVGATNSGRGGGPNGSPGDFPLKNPVQSQNLGGDQAFVTKLSPNGATLVYSTYLGGKSGSVGGANGGGTGETIGNAIAIDPSGSAYVTGQTNSADFPTTTNAYQSGFGSTDNKGERDAFVTKFSADGRTLVYSTFLHAGATLNAAAASRLSAKSSSSAAPNDDRGQGIAVDPSGSAYVTGQTVSPGFSTKNAYQSNFAGNRDAFVTKLNPGGTALAYSTYLGGTGQDYGYAIALDSSGSAYVTGQTDSGDFPAKNAYQPNNGGGLNAFVTKLSPDATSLAYSTYLGANSVGRGIAVDSSDDAYVTGSVGGSNIPTKDVAQATYGGGGSDVFVTKLSTDGMSLAYSTFLGGSATDDGFGIALDPSRGAYVVGQTTSTDFPTKNAEQGAYKGGDATLS